jgi:hypothetical protein
MSQGLRAPLAALLLLGYHTYAGHIFGRVTDVSLRSQSSFVYA